MLGSPRIVAIDDDEVHLCGLARGLSWNGMACLQVHFTGDASGIAACPDVRIVFVDLHLGAGTPSDHTADFAVITALLEDTIKPSGPYFIVLWTQYQDQAPALRDYLRDRLGSGVAKPLDVCSLSKSEHIDFDDDDKIRDRDTLMEAIGDILQTSPQVGAVIDWETQVLGAAGRTVSSILDLPSVEDDEQRAAEVGRILGRLAVEAVGKDHVEKGRFRAVNDALVPILADRMARTPAGQIDDELWQAALTIPERQTMESLERAAKLNRLVHIADPEGAGAAERGVVVPLPASHYSDFHDLFGIEEQDAATRRFRCKSAAFDPSSAPVRWVLVQCQAACDYAQSNPGSVPFYLGLDFPAEHRASKSPPDSTWCGPVFQFDGETRCLRVNAGFPLALASSGVQEIAPLYRLREQILNDLVYHLHSHGARPGMMSFGKR